MGLLTLVEDRPTPKVSRATLQLLDVLLIESRRPYTTGASGLALPSPVLQHA